MKQAHEFRAKSVFDTQKARGNPQQLPLPLPSGMSVFDMQEWYQLVIGRYLAPARIGASSGVEYLLRGEDLPGKHLRLTIRQEVNALEADLKQLGAWLKLQAESKGDVVKRLWALVSILELRLPDPEADPESFRICQGALQITQWGIERGQERRIADLVSDGSALRDYCKSVRTALRVRYLDTEVEVEPSLAPTVPNSATFRSDLLVDDPAQVAKTSSPRNALLSGFVGALLSAVALLSFYEGRHLLDMLKNWNTGDSDVEPVAPEELANPAGSSEPPSTPGAPPMDSRPGTPVQPQKRAVPPATQGLNDSTAPASPEAPTSTPGDAGAGASASTPAPLPLGPDRSPSKEASNAPRGALHQDQRTDRPVPSPSTGTEPQPVSPPGGPATVPGAHLPALASNHSRTTNQTLTPADLVTRSRTPRAAQ